MSKFENSAEYSRLRAIARKRLNRLEIQFPNSNIYKANSDKFLKVKEIKNQKQLDVELRAVKAFLRQPTSTVSGYKKHRANDLAYWEERGILKFANKDNYEDVVKFLKLLEDKGSVFLFDSDKIYMQASKDGKKPERVMSVDEAWEEYQLNNNLLNFSDLPEERQKQYEIDDRGVYTFKAPKPRKRKRKRKRK